MSLVGHDAALEWIQGPNFREIGKNAKRKKFKVRVND